MNIHSAKVDSVRHFGPHYDTCYLHRLVLPVQACLHFCTRKRPSTKIHNCRTNGQTNSQCRLDTGNSYSCMSDIHVQLALPGSRRMSRASRLEINRNENQFLTLEKSNLSCDKIINQGEKASHGEPASVSLARENWIGSRIQSCRIRLTSQILSFRCVAGLLRSLCAQT